MTHWNVTGKNREEYASSIDKSVMYNGNPSERLDCIVPQAQSYGALVRRMDANSIAASGYHGKRVRFTAALKTSEVSNWSGLWMRVDGPEKDEREYLSFDNMNNRAIRGTAAWQEYAIVLDVPAEAINISFGALLNGNGQIWLADARMEIVGNDVEVTSIEKATA